MKGGKGKCCNRIKGGWHWEKLKCKNKNKKGRSIFKIRIKLIHRNRLQFTCLVLMGFGEATTLEESQLGEVTLR